MWCEDGDDFFYDAKAYRQVRVQKENRHRITWIPVQYAFKGKVLRFQRDDDTWDEGWEVQWVGEIVKSGSDLHMITQMMSRIS